MSLALARKKFYPTNWRRVLHVVFVLAVLMSFAACASRAPLRIDGPPVSEQQRQEILQHAATRRLPETSIRGVWSARVEEGGGAATVRYVVLWQPPGRLRIEVVPPQAFYTLQLLVVNNGRVVFLDARERQAVVSQNVRGLMQRVLRFAASPQEVMQYLLAMPELRGPSSAGIQVFTPTDETYAIIEPQRHFWFVDQQRLLPKRLVVQEPFQEKRVLEANYAAYRQFGNLLAPTSTTLTLSSRALSMQLHLQQLMVDVDFSPALFTPPIPASYERIT